MIQMQNIKTGEKILIKDKRQLKLFLKFKYAIAPKNVTPLINRKGYAIKRFSRKIRC